MFTLFLLLKPVLLTSMTICLIIWALAFFTDTVFLDLKKAFDTVHHNVLINKLQSLGIYGLELGWF